MIRGCGCWKCGEFLRIVGQELAPTYAVKRMGVNASVTWHQRVKRLSDFCEIHITYKFFTGKKPPRNYVIHNEGDGSHKFLPTFSGMWNETNIGRRIILKWFLRTRMVWRELYLSGSGYRLVACCHEHGNEPSGSIKYREFFG